jgi:hypothetical protein
MGQLSSVMTDAISIRCCIGVSEFKDWTRFLAAARDLTLGRAMVGNKLDDTQSSHFFQICNVIIYGLLLASVSVCNDHSTILLLVVQSPSVRECSWVTRYTGFEFITALKRECSSGRTST